MTVVFAHAGHWLAGLAYAAPVLILVGWMAVVKFKDAQARRRGEPTAAERERAAAEKERAEADDELDALDAAGD